jgi:nicotinate-nucleotide adenylyltransferase
MKLGILGGTFDPPHIGHLILADQCACALALDRVLFIPSFHPPHKLDRAMSPFPDRMEMTRLAIGEDPRLTVLSLEEQRGGVSYTVDTLTDLKRLHGSDELWLLLGEDSLADLPGWREPEQILGLARIAVYRRRGAGGEIPTRWRNRTQCISGPLVDISSTELRAMLRSGASVRHLIPPAVMDYIRGAQLYGRTSAPRARGGRR